MFTLAESFQAQRAFARPGFCWDSADAYLFDIDGTLLNSRDAVHYFSFRNAVREILGIDATIDGVPVHGNTDMGIARAVLRRSGLGDEEIDAHLPAIMSRMCAEVALKREELQPELCASILEVVSHLHEKHKLLGVASGNLEPIGWLKLEKAGLRPMFSFGSFSHPRESRADIFRHGLDLIAQKAGASATTFIVGDTPSDVTAARAVGVPVITLATGIYSFTDLLGCSPDACFSSAAEMIEPSHSTIKT